MVTFIGFDTETTGLDPVEHRFVEVYAGLYDLGTGKKLKEMEFRIDPQRPIMADAQRVHGISASDLIGKPLWADVAQEVLDFVNLGDFMVAHNGIGFDGPFLNSELKRVGLPSFTKPILDTMVDARWATCNGKLPNLGELCFACEVDYDPSKAHAAAFDVDVMTQCFLKGLEWNFYTIPQLAQERLAA